MVVKVGVVVVLGVDWAGRDRCFSALVLLLRASLLHVHDTLV